LVRRLRRSFVTSALGDRRTRPGDGLVRGDI
jgi:hypothetical protein